MSVKQKWYEKIYALYKGEVFLSEGTLPEIAKNTDKSLDFLKWMRHPSSIKRIDKGKNRLRLVPLDDDEEEDCIECG